jgi:hypothetical protein
MEWILVGVLVLVIIVLASIYRRSVAECRALRSLTILILLKDDVYQTQRNGIIALVRGAQAKDPIGLSTAVMLALDAFAVGVASSSAAGAHATLWQLRQQLDKQKAQRS